MVLKVFPKGDFLGLLICCSQKNSDQETLKIPFVAISFKSNLRMTGLILRACEELLTYFIGTVNDAAFFEYEMHKNTIIIYALTKNIHFS